MKEAQRITDEALLEILNFLKPGLTESEVAARLTYIMARKGAERNSFDPTPRYRIMSCLGERVMSTQPSSVSMITSSMRTPNLPGR